MNFALLWVDGLIVSLLWVATMAAFIGRLPKRWTRGFLALITYGVPPLFLFSFFCIALQIKVTAASGPGWLAYSLTLLVAYLIGMFLICHRALRGTPGMPRASASWSRLPLLLAFIIASGVGYMMLLNMDLAMRARCAIESVKVNSRYLAALPAVPSYSQNAAMLYEKAFARLSADPPTSIKNPPFGNADAFDPHEPATIAFLKREADTIDLLHRASAMPGCRFEQDLSDPDVSTLLENLNQDRNAANVLNLHARAEIAQGHAVSAIIDTASILRMSRHFGRRPMILSGMVGIGIAELGDRTLGQTLPAITSEQELAGLHLEELEPMGQIFQEALRGEELFGLNMFSDIPPPPMQVAINGVAPPTPLMSPGSTGPIGAFARVFYLNADGYVRLLDSMQHLSTQPWYQIKGSLDQVFHPADGNGLLTSILIPSFDRNFETLARIEATDACARVAVAMTRFRLAQGVLPQHLADLVPAYLDAIPADPFDGKPLRLAIKNNQWIIYSIGSNTIDDGGIEGKHGNGDVVFILKPGMLSLPKNAP